MSRPSARSRSGGPPARPPRRRRPAAGPAASTPAPEAGASTPASREARPRQSEPADPAGPAGPRPIPVVRRVGCASEEPSQLRQRLLHEVAHLADRRDIVDGDRQQGGRAHAVEQHDAPLVLEDHPGEGPLRQLTPDAFGRFREAGRHRSRDHRVRRHVPCLLDDEALAVGQHGEAHPGRGRDGLQLSFEVTCRHLGFARCRNFAWWLGFAWCRSFARRGGSRRRYHRRRLRMSVDGGRRSAQERVDLPDELFGGEGLEHDVARLDFGGAREHGAVDHTRDEEHRRATGFRVGADELADLVPVLVRQDHVADDEVGAVPLEALHRLAARRRRKHFQRAALERFRDHPPHADAVVDNQHLQHLTPPGPYSRGDRAGGSTGPATTRAAGAPVTGPVRPSSMSAAMASNSCFTLRSMVFCAPESMRSRGSNAKLPRPSWWAVATSAANAASPVSRPNSACTTRPRSKTIRPVPPASVNPRSPVLAPSAMACARSGRSITASEPRRPDGARSPAAAWRGAAADASRLPTSVTMVCGVNSPTSMRSGPPSSALSGTSSPDPASRRKSTSAIDGSLRTMEQSSQPSTSGTVARLTIRLGRSRSSIVSANEPLVTPVTFVKPAAASAFSSAPSAGRSGSIRRIRGGRLKRPSPPPPGPRASRRAARTSPRPPAW